MNKRVEQHLEQYCKNEGWKIESGILLEILQGAKRLARKEINQCRWWNEYLYVVEINGMFIGYVYAEANRDESMSDLGYEFDFSTICEMQLVEKIIEDYEYVEE